MSYQFITLSKICDFLNGGTPSRSISRYFEGNIPWITGADISEEQDIVTKSRFLITNEAIESSATKIVPKGNIVLVSRTGVGKVAITGVDICISQDFTGIVPDKSRIDVRYLYRFLRSKKTYFVYQQRGATIQGITRQVIADLEIPLPPLAEQQRIAAILDKADALRTKRRAALAKLDTLLQATFLHMFGDPVTNPMGWESLPVSKVAQVKGGLQVSGKRKDCPIEMPYLRVANVYRDRLDLDEIKTLKINEQELRRTSLTVGDILVVEGHGNPNEIGRAAVWDGSIEPCVHQNHLIRVQANREKILPTYMSNYLNSEGGRRQLIRAGKTTSGLNTISSSQVRETKVLVPPLNLQKIYLDQVHKIQTLKESYLRSLQKLDTLFHSLQQRAFKGEL